MGEDGAGRQTGRDFKKRITRNRTGRDKRVWDAGQDGMNIWLSRRALVHTISIGRALVDCQHKTQMGGFFESNVLEQYLSNVLWPDQTKTNNFHSNDIWHNSLLSTHSFNYVSCVFLLL